MARPIPGAAGRAVGALLTGVVFGFLLSRAEATSYRRILGMFLLRDPHLYVVIGVAVAVAAVGLRLVARWRGGAAALRAHHKPRHVGNLVGGLVFGAGWALTGTCPGTALAQLGEGRLAAGVTVAGMLLGAALHVRLGRGWLARLQRATGRGRS